MQTHHFQMKNACKWNETKMEFADVTYNFIAPIY